MQNDSNVFFNRFARNKKETQTPHRSTLAMLKDENLSPVSRRRRRSSQGLIPVKRVA